MKIITMKLAVFDSDSSDIAQRLTTIACTHHDAYLLKCSILAPNKQEEALMLAEHPELVLTDKVLQPKNFHVKCYATEHRIHIAGDLVQDDESHNCDEHGCSTWEHILAKHDKVELHYWRTHITPTRLRKAQRTAKERRQSH